MENCKTVVDCGLKGTPFHRSFQKVTKIPDNIALSLLNFMYENKGHMAGSVPLAMYMNMNKQENFKINDLDIYIPVKNVPMDKPKKLRGPQTWASINAELGKISRLDPKKNDIRKVEGYGIPVPDWLFILNRFKSYFCDYIGVYNMVPNIKSNYYSTRADFALPWSRIADFISVINDTTGFEPNRDYGLTPPLDLPDLQLIFVHENTNIEEYIRKNYDFAAVKVYTTLDPANPIKAIDEYYVKQKVLNSPENWGSITLIACFKTVVNRFLKYTKRGFIPLSYKTKVYRERERRQLGEQGIEPQDRDIVTAYNIFLKILKLYLLQKIRNVFDRSVDGTLKMDYEKARLQKDEVNNVVVGAKNDFMNDTLFEKVSENIQTYSKGDVRMNAAEGITAHQKQELLDLFDGYLDVIANIGDEFYSLMMKRAKEAERYGRQPGAHAPHTTYGQPGDIIKYIDNQLRELKRIKNNEKALVERYFSQIQFKDPKEVPADVSKYIAAFLPKYGGKYKLKKSRKSRKSKK